MPVSPLPTVSCVVATYNFGRFLPRALDSILAQDYPADRLSVIVVDDGSTDGTAKLMAAYADRVRYLRQANQGVLATYSRGLAEARGDYIALLDGDDEWLPHRLRASVGLLEARPDLGLVHGDLEVVDGEGELEHESFFAQQGMRDLEGDLLGRLLAGNVVTTSALTVRGALKDRFWPIPAWGRAQDWWISLRVAEVSGIGCLPQPVARYRVHGANMNHGQTGERRTALLRRELPVRRWGLTKAATAGVPGRELYRAAVSYLAAVEAVGGATGELAATIVPVDGHDAGAAAERLEHGERALAAGRDEEAARALAAALGHDLHLLPAQQALFRLAALRGWSLAAPTPAPRARVPIGGARPFVTLADAEELVARPELLAAYEDEFAGDEDATLVVRLKSGPGDLAALEATVDRLERPDAVDLLAIPADGSTAAAPGDLARGADAVLSAVLPRGALGSLPCGDQDGLGALRALARGNAPSFGITICAPSWTVAPAWGDLYFARALQQELHRRGLPCAIHPMDEWERARRHDVVIHLQGLSLYEPAPGQRCILWCISHPERLTREACERTDLVCVASTRFASRLAPRVDVPVRVLEQATDPRVFFPEHDPAHARELVFVGNSRRVMRRILRDLLPTERDLAIWGGDWRGLIDTRHVVGSHLPNESVRRAYSSAGLVLNDHWDDMRKQGFVANRLYDAVACGAVVVSDALPELEERFAGAVVTYRSRDELHETIARLLARPEEREERARAGRERVLAEHTFGHRVDALLAELDSTLGLSLPAPALTSG